MTNNETGDDDGLNRLRTNASNPIEHTMTNETTEDESETEETVTMARRELDELLDSVVEKTIDATIEKMEARREQCECEHGHAETETVTNAATESASMGLPGDDAGFTDSRGEQRQPEPSYAAIPGRMRRNYASIDEDTDLDEITSGTLSGYRTRTRDDADPEDRGNTETIDCAGTVSARELTGRARERKKQRLADARTK